MWILVFIFVTSTLLAVVWLEISERSHCQTLPCSRFSHGAGILITDMRSLVVPGIVLALVAHSNGKSVAMGSTPQPPFWPHYSGARSVTLLDGTWNYG